jgi:uncharacterized DUF497 family protein
MLDKPNYWGYKKHVDITFDHAKRVACLKDRGLDFEDAIFVFLGPTLNMADERVDYGEDRTITIGYLAGRMVIVVWTERDDARHIISMRKANDREQKAYQVRLG